LVALCRMAVTQAAAIVSQAVCMLRVRLPASRSVASYPSSSQYVHYEYVYLILVAGAQFSGLARSHVVPPPGCGQAVCGPQRQRLLVVHYLRWYMFTDGITVRSITTSIGCNYSSATRKILFPGLTCAFGAHLRRLLLLASARSQAAWLPGTLFTTNSSVNV
jgi:hypothetical protein